MGFQEFNPQSFWFPLLLEAFHGLHEYESLTGHQALGECALGTLIKHTLFCIFWALLGTVKPDSDAPSLIINLLR